MPKSYATTYIKSNEFHDSWLPDHAGTFCCVLPLAVETIRKTTTLCMARRLASELQRQSEVSQSLDYILLWHSNGTLISAEDTQIRQGKLICCMRSTF